MSNTTGTGFVCPKCGQAGCSVYDSRLSPHGYFKRRRKCKSCQERFTTIETVVEGYTKGSHRKLIDGYQAPLSNLRSLKDAIVELSNLAETLVAEHDESGCHV